MHGHLLDGTLMKEMDIISLFESATINRTGVELDRSIDHLLHIYIWYVVRPFNYLDLL